MQAFPARAQSQESSPQTPEAESSAALEVTIYPNSVQRRLDNLVGYLNSSEPDPQKDALLTLDASNELYNNGDTGMARELLKQSLERVESTNGDPIAQASLLHALSEIDYTEGDYRQRVKNLIKAEEALAGKYGKDHEITALARLKTTKAYAETELSSPNNGYLQQSLRRSKDIRQDIIERYGEDHPVAIKAALSTIGIKVGMRLNGAALNDIETFIKTHADNNEAVMAALVLKARMYRFQKNSRALDETLQEISTRAGELDEPVMAVDVLDRDMRSSFDRSKQELFSIDGRGPNGSGSVISVTSPDQLSSEIAGNFVDVSFCIDAAGRVRNMNVMDSEGSASWVEQAAEAIGRKRYVTGNSEHSRDTNGDPDTNPDTVSEEDTVCHWKYERYKVMSHKINITGTRIRRHSPLTYLVRENLLANNNLTPDYLRLVSEDVSAKAAQ